MTAENGIQEKERFTQFDPTLLTKTELSWLQNFEDKKILEGLALNADGWSHQFNISKTDAAKAVGLLIYSEGSNEALEARTGVLEEAYKIISLGSGLNFDANKAAKAYFNFNKILKEKGTERGAKVDFMNLWGTIYSIDPYKLESAAEARFKAYEPIFRHAIFTPWQYIGKNLKVYYQELYNAVNSKANL